jgi:hypothetical protein
MTFTKRSNSEPLPELDTQFYRSTYPDLANFSDSALRRHFEMHGISEGRAGSSASTRPGFLQLIPQDNEILEIGPFCNPLLRGENVSYFDVFDSAQLKVNAALHGLSDEACPHINYVSATGDLSVVDRKFSFVFSSHCIEHQPDLISHLNGVLDILDQSGKYFLIIPDKRFCFDFFNPETTIIDVLAAYAEKRAIHSASSILRHRTMLTHNDPARHWNGDHTDPSSGQRTARTLNAINEIRQNSGVYIDVHAWAFTPTSFREIINSLNEMDLCDLEIEQIYPTVRGSLEFFAVLRNRGAKQAA